MTDVMTIGRMASGKVRMLKSVNAGNTTSVLKGRSLVKTNTVNVEQDTRNGVDCHVKFATDCVAPILRSVFNSKSFRIWLSLFMKAVFQA